MRYSSKAPEARYAFCRRARHLTTRLQGRSSRGLRRGPRGWPENRCCLGPKTQSTPLLSLLKLPPPGSINLPPVKLRQALLYFGAPESRKPALHSGSGRKNKAAQLLRVAVVRKDLRLASRQRRSKTVVAQYSPKQPKRTGTETKRSTEGFRDQPFEGL